ncbi:MAG: Ig-like domain-containing protein [Gemmatimonadaceae bacterium]|nr:Ig-like domain-containing protein [Gemmatimonadaceae bacterium]
MKNRFAAVLCCLVVAAACGSDPQTTPTPPTCSVASVTVAPATLTLPVAQTAPLAASISQQNCGTLTPTWSSANQAVATVSTGGVVTAVAQGTTTITATVNNRQGTAQVTVPQCVTGIALSTTALSIAVPLTSRIDAVVTPANCPGATITWSSSAPGIATVGNGNVTAVAAGTATITATIGSVSATAVATIVSSQLGSVWDESTLRVVGGADAPRGYISAAWAASPTDLFVAAYPSFYRYNGTTWSTLTGDGYGVEAMWGSSATNVFGVGELIKRSDGASWVEMTKPTTQRLRAVWGSSASNVFAVGQAGTILRFNGTAWSAMTSPTTANLVSISGASENLVFAVSEDGSIIRYNGTSWSVVVPPSGSFLTGISMINASLGYAIGSAGALKYDGATWAEDPTFIRTNEIPRAIWASSASNVVVTGENGTLRRFDGTSWSSPTRRTAMSLYLLAGSASTAFAFGTGVIVQQSGASTSLVYAAPELKGVWAVDANVAYAVGYDGAIWRYQNGSWQYQSTGTFTQFEAIWGSSASELVAVGTDPQTQEAVSHRYNGTTWQRSAFAQAVAPVALWGTSMSNILAAARFGPLQRYDGATWSNATTTTPPSLNAMWGTSATDVLLVGSSGYVARYNGAGTVTPISTGITSALVSVWGSSPTNYFMGTNNSTFYRFNGTTLTPMTIPAQTSAVYGIWGTGPNQVYAVDYNGNVMRFDGTQWVQLRLSSGETFYYEALHGTAARLFAVGPRGSVMVTR